MKNFDSPTILFRDHTVRSFEQTAYLLDDSSYVGLVTIKLIRNNNPKFYFSMPKKFYKGI